MTKNTVTAYALNIREEPGPTFKVVGYLRQKEVVTVLELSPDGNWKKIQTTAGQTGWCSSKYLANLPDDTPPSNDGSGAGKYRVTATALSVRAGPGTQYTVVGHLRKDEIVEAVDIASDGPWRKIKRTNGLVGWCSVIYLTASDSNVPPPDNEIALGKHRVTATDSLNVREGSSLNYRILGGLTPEQIVDVQEISKDKQWKKIITARGLRGWSYREYLVSLGNEATPRQNEEFPWMPIAFGELNMREFPGSLQNPRIQEYLTSTNLENAANLSDETDWCAAFVNWCVKQSGLPGTDSAMVNPWMQWGQALALPRRGCITVFQWQDGGQHVAFYLGETGAYLRTLGGNQSDAVWISSYLKTNVVGYRIPL